MVAYEAGSPPGNAGTVVDFGDIIHAVGTRMTVPVFDITGVIEPFFMPGIAPPYNGASCCNKAANCAAVGGFQSGYPPEPARIAAACCAAVHGLPVAQSVKDVPVPPFGLGIVSFFGSPCFTSTAPSGPAAPP